VTAEDIVSSEGYENSFQWSSAVEEIIDEIWAQYEIENPKQG
jgi:hypothetical protein